jgi:hypothetical protein
MAVLAASTFNLASPSAAAAAAAASDCQVPICDFNETLKRLEGMNLEERSNFLGALYNEYRGTSELAPLRNLREFGRLSYALSKRLNDPTAVLSWSVYLRESAIYGLLRSAPLDLAEDKSMIDEIATIPELSKDRQMRIRYDTLLRWRAEVPTILDLQLVYDLFDFVGYITKASQSAKDEDYVLREASTVVDFLGNRISYLNPAYEGVYEIRASCLPEAKACEGADMKADRLVLMNSISDLGIFTTLVNAPSSITSFLFNKTLLEDAGLQARANSEVLSVSGRPSRLLARFDRATQNVRGQVLTSRYTGTLDFTGRILFSPVKYYMDEGAPSAPAPIPGQYEGRIGDKKVRLIVRQKDEKILIASAFTMINGSSEPMVWDFTIGEYVAHRGVLNLVGFGSTRMSPFKLVLAYRRGTDGKNHWVGGYFSLLGKFEEASFDRTGEVDESNLPPELRVRL